MAIGDDENMTYTWDAVPTPIGLVVATFAPHAIISAHVANDDPQWEIESVSRQLHVVPTHSPGKASELAAELEEYFSGTRREFTIPIDLTLAGSGFTRDALEAIAQIPYGETASYGEVAVLAGRPRAARAVGSACRTTPISLLLPVHRVVRSDGTIGEYGSSPDVKRFLVELEATNAAAIQQN